MRRESHALRRVSRAFDPALVFAIRQNQQRLEKITFFPAQN